MSNRVEFKYDIRVSITSSSGGRRSLHWRCRPFSSDLAARDWAVKQQQDLLRQYPGWKLEEGDGLVVTHLDGQ